MTGEKRLYRSRNALIGGVCSGIANYFNVDPLVVRILTVVFTLASGGLLAIAYIALWVVVPKEPKSAAPVEVEPQEVHSETYGAVDPTTSAAHAASSRYTAPLYTGTAHVPPQPPAGASWVRQGEQPVPPSVAQQPQPAKESSDSSVKAALWAGSFLLFFGVVAMFATFVEDIVWWQYWPLIFVIVGIVRMVVPGKPGKRMRGFVDGLVCFFAGATLLSMSLGLVSWHSLELMLVSLWPLLLMMIGLFILGSALDSPVMLLLVGVCFAAFCVIGLIWYSVPGSVEQIVFTAPYGRDYYFSFRP